MYNVTQDFIDNIYANSRSVVGRVTFDISPVNIEAETPTITTTSEFAISLASTQLTDNVRQQTYKMATWETDRVLLDGSFTFPADTSSGWGEVGWTSNTICNSSNTFTTPQVATLEYISTYTSAGLTITFDPLAGEYATEFSITVYDASNGVIYTSSVTGNTLTQYVIQQAFNNFKKISVSISKWSGANRRARVVEIDPGVILVYDDQKLIRMSLTEQMDTISSTLAIPEFDFTVSNQDGEFDILNPSGIYSSLQARQKIMAELGLELDRGTEWVPLGVFYLSEWRSDTGSTTTTFYGRSKIDLLDLATYGQTTAQTSYDLADMAEDVLDAAGVIGYSVDAALSSTATNGLITSTSCRNALQQVAIAGRSTVRVTRDDTLKLETTRSATSVDSIDYNSIFEEPQIQQFKQVSEVDVTYFTNLTTTGGILTVTDSTVQNGEVIKVENITIINNSTTAAAVANWLKARRNERNLFAFNYRGNPALELNDVIAVENAYTTNQNIVITKHELTYEGFLRGRIEGRLIAV